MPDSLPSDSAPRAGQRRPQQGQPVEEYQYVVPRPMSIREAVKTHGLFVGTLSAVLIGTIIVASRPVEPEVARLNARIASTASNSSEVADLQKQLIQTQAALAQTEKALAKNEQALRLALNLDSGPSAPAPRKEPALDLKGYAAEIRHVRDAIYSANRELVADERSLKQDLVALGANRQALAYADLDLDIAKGLKPANAALPHRDAGDYLSAEESVIPVNLARQPAGYAMLSKPVTGSVDELRAIVVEDTGLLSDCEDAIRARQRRIVDIESEIRGIQDRIRASHKEVQDIRSAPARAEPR